MSLYLAFDLKKDIKQTRHTVDLFCSNLSQSRTCLISISHPLVEKWLILPYIVLACIKWSMQLDIGLDGNLHLGWSITSSHLTFPWSVQSSSDFFLSFRHYLIFVSLPRGEEQGRDCLLRPWMRMTLWVNLKANFVAVKLCFLDESY